MSSYNAPALRFQVRRSRFLWCSVLGVAVAGGLALVGWSSAGAPPSAFALAGAALLWLACTGVALHFVHHLPQGVLVWDGATWFLEIPGQPPVAGHLQVHMDAQARMLLSLCGEGHAVHWIWVERHMHSACWMDLRRAVYSRPRLDAGPAHPTDTS